MPIRIPKSFAVQPLKQGEFATSQFVCGTCGLSWDDAKVTSMTPTPSGRCPFETFHKTPARKKKRQSRNNRIRASWAKESLDTMTKIVGDAGDVQTNMGDLVCNLMHLADREKIQWDEVVRLALVHYKGEVTPDDFEEGNKLREI